MTLTYVLVGLFSAATLILLGVVAFQRRRNVLLGTAIVALFAALIAQSIYIFAPDAHRGPYAWLFLNRFTQPSLGVALQIVALAAYVPLGFVFLNSVNQYVLPGSRAKRRTDEYNNALRARRQQRTILIITGLLMLVWSVSVAILIATLNETDGVGISRWINRAASTTDGITLLAVIGGVGTLAGIAIVADAYRRFLREDLPERADRYLLWAIAVPLVFFGTALAITGTYGVRESGWALKFGGLALSTYAALSPNVIDTRRLLRGGTGAAILVALTAGLVLAALIIGRQTDSLFVYAVIAIGAALIFIPFRLAAQAALNWTLGSDLDEPPGNYVRRYLQAVGGIVELAPLASIATAQLRVIFKVKRAGLLIITSENDGAYRLEVMTLSDMQPGRLKLTADNALIKHFQNVQDAIRQHDLETLPEFDSLSADIVKFFKSLRMVAYAPVMITNGDAMTESGGALIGLLAVGTKLNEESFSKGELDLLSTLASQTGIALRNARLVNDLQQATSQLQSSNADAVNARSKLEQLDSVKTDFVTIASHELRTPLAQIRGYTDILDAMNESKMLDQDQVAGMTNSLRKATDRLERLIADMLDVSQLGLDAMDLRFTQTSVDSVMRLAIEPLAESIKQRKLQLTARGLRGLPPIEADMQRLVQAFRNIILNAIKYTPDGGKIDIVGTLEKNGEKNVPGGVDRIVIEIADTGIGIDSRYHDLIFEKFFRVADPGLHSTGATKFMGAGPGLGLTIARGVVRGHGGEIRVESPGFSMDQLPGSRFIIALPVTPPTEARRVMPFEGANQQPSSTQTQVLAQVK